MRKGISGSTLKIMAMLFMLCDHIGYVLLGPFVTGAEGTAAAYYILRAVIGRWAFPIYCFLLVEGFQKTRSRKKYGLRLFLFALVSEVPFDLAFYGSPFSQTHCNIFFTLLLSVIMMELMEKAEERLGDWRLRALCQAGAFLCAALAAELIRCDYGAKGILAVALLYVFRKKKGAQLLAGCAAFLWEITAPLAFLPVAFYNGEKGLKLKYVFYLFYPGHLLALYFLWQLYFSGLAY